jgi:hypothetical protein
MKKADNDHGLTHPQNNRTGDTERAPTRENMKK